MAFSPDISCRQKDAQTLLFRRSDIMSVPPWHLNRPQPTDWLADYVDIRCTGVVHLTPHQTQSALFRSQFLFHITYLLGLHITKYVIQSFQYFCSDRYLHIWNYFPMRDNMGTPFVQIILCLHPSQKDPFNSNRIGPVKSIWQIKHKWVQKYSCVRRRNNTVHRIILGSPSHDPHMAMTPNSPLYTLF